MFIMQVKEGKIMKNIKLYYIFLITFLLLTCSISAYASQSITAVTFDGKSVLLKPNGTWEFMETVAQYSDETFDIGTTIKLGDVSFCVNSARFDKDNDLAFLILDCTVQNISTHSFLLSSMLMLNLKDEKGYYQDQSYFANTKGSLDGELSVNQILRGEVAYEIDLSNEYYWEFVFKPDLVNPGQAVYLIMKEQIK